MIVHVDKCATCPCLRPNPAAKIDECGLRPGKDVKVAEQRRARWCPLNRMDVHLVGV